MCAKTLQGCCERRVGDMVANEQSVSFVVHGQADNPVRSQWARELMFTYQILAKWLEKQFQTVSSV